MQKYVFPFVFMGKATASEKSDVYITLLVMVLKILPCTALNHYSKEWQVVIFPNSPFFCGASEKPYPGIEGHTTSNTRSSGSDGCVNKGINP